MRRRPHRQACWLRALPLPLAVGCGAPRAAVVPDTAAPGPPPATASAMGVPAGTAPSGPALRFRVPLGVRPRTRGEGLQVLAGPCAFNPGYLVDHPLHGVWGIQPERDTAPLTEVDYGVAPAGYRTTVAAERLADGCYCVRLEPCCDADAELELGAGAVRSTCERWGSAIQPLPPGELNAYGFGEHTREESAWKVRGAEIEVFDVRHLGRVVPPRAHLQAEQLPWPDAPPTALVAADGAPPGDSVRAELVALVGDGPRRDLYVRWIGTRQSLSLAMLVDRQREPRITLLMNTLIQANGIEGVCAHAVGDVDGDGLSDLVYLAEPFLDCCERPREVEATVVLTAAGSGLHPLRLGTTDELFALGQRCLGRGPDGPPVFSPESWRFRIASGQVALDFAKPGGCGRRWTFRLLDGELHLDPPSPASASSSSTRG